MPLHARGAFYLVPSPEFLFPAAPRDPAPGGQAGSFSVGDSN